jgi:hypothetical protein
MWKRRIKFLKFNGKCGNKYFKILTYTRSKEGYLALLIRCVTESATYKLRNASYEVTDSNLRNRRLLLDGQLVQRFLTKKNFFGKQKRCALTTTPIHMTNFTNSTLVFPLTTEMQMYLSPIVFVKHVHYIDFKNANLECFPAYFPRQNYFTVFLRPFLSAHTRFMYDKDSSYALYYPNRNQINSNKFYYLFMCTCKHV